MNFNWSRHTINAVIFNTLNPTLFFYLDGTSEIILKRTCLLTEGMCIMLKKIQMVKPLKDSGKIVDCDSHKPAE